MDRFVKNIFILFYGGRKKKISSKKGGNCCDPKNFSFSFISFPDVVQKERVINFRKMF